MRKTTLHILVFVVVMLVGLVAIRTSLPLKLALIVLFLAVLLILSVFAPIFTRQIMDGALYSAVAVVLAIWFVWHVVRAAAALAAAQKVRREQKAESAEQTAESQAPKAEAEEVRAPEKEGDSPFASPSPPEASKPPEAGGNAGADGASSEPQEGDRTDA
jgi:uncharacterized membrane protein YedE/YeeE